MSTGPGSAPHPPTRGQRRDGPAVAATIFPRRAGVSYEARSSMPYQFPLIEALSKAHVPSPVRCPTHGARGGTPMARIGCSTVRRPAHEGGRLQPSHARDYQIDSPARDRKRGSRPRTPWASLHASHETGFRVDPLLTPSAFASGSRQGLPRRIGHRHAPHGAPQGIRSDSTGKCIRPPGRLKDRFRNGAPPIIMVEIPPCGVHA